MPGIVVPSGSLTLGEQTMAGNIVPYATGRFAWTYTPGVTPATELRLKWGVNPGVYPNGKVLAVATTGSVAVSAVLPTGSQGQYYARMYAANAAGEGAASPEVPFVLSAPVPDGQISFSIG